MTDSVAGEVARIQAPAEVEQMIKGELAAFGRTLPNGISRDAFGTWAVRMLTKALNDRSNPKQLEAWHRVLDPGNEAGRLSVIVALRECAELGLRPGSEYHLVPFGNTVTGITDYHGEIRLITNHEPCSVVVELVRKGDKFVRLGANIPPKHEFDPWMSRGPIVGGYCYVAYPGDRYSLVVFMPKSAPVNDDGEPDPDVDCFDAHQALAKTQAIWKASYEAMCKKTLVHAERDFVPWSAERKW